MERNAPAPSRAARWSIHHSRLQLDQILEVAAVQRKLVHAIARHDDSQIGGRGVDQRSCRLHRHSLIDGADHQCEVDPRAGSGRELKHVAAHMIEARGRGLQVISACGKQRKLVVAIGVGGRAMFFIGVLVVS